MSSFLDSIVSLDGWIAVEVFDDKLELSTVFLLPLCDCVSVFAIVCVFVFVMTHIQFSSHLESNSHDICQIVESWVKFMSHVMF